MCIVLGINVKILQLFPISIYAGDVTFSDELLVHLKGLDQQKIIYNGSYNGNITNDKQVLNHDICAPLKEQVQVGMNEFILNYYKVQFDGKFFIHRSWVLEHQPGHWSQPHSHPNSILSGVLYLDVPADSGEIQFHKPDNYHNWINTATLRFMVDEFHEYNCDTWRIPPYTGQMFIFPSHLRHSVELNVTQESRWSLAFDCFLEGLLDSGDPATRGPRITREDGERMADLPYPP